MGPVLVAAPARHDLAWGLAFNAACSASRSSRSQASTTLSNFLPWFSSGTLATGPPAGQIDGFGQKGH